MYIFIGISFITNFIGFVVTLTDKIHKVEHAHLKGVMFSAIGIGNGVSMI